MKQRHLKYTALFLSLLLAQVSSAYGAKIFVSNNQRIISPKAAYTRMWGKEQASLQYKTIGILQNQYYQEGRIRRTLGAYFMQNSKKITADNTLLFITSPIEAIDEDKLKQTATLLTRKFNQESVALFVDQGDQQNADITLTFHNDTRYMDIQAKIATLESLGLAAFSIYFEQNSKNLDRDNITKIEWLTTADKAGPLKKIFKDATVEEHTGEAFLVFADGRAERLF